MNDLPPDARPVPPPEPDPTPTQAIPAQQSPDPEAPASAPARQPLRDRLWSFRALIAVALASVIIGGLGGAALANVSQGGDDGRPGPGQFNRGGPGGPGMMDRGPRNGKQFPDRREMDHRHWNEDGDRPGQPLTPLPSRTLPKSSG